MKPPSAEPAAAAPSPASATADALAHPVHPGGFAPPARGPLPALLMALACALVAAVQPAYALGPLLLPALSVVLGLQMAAAVGLGWGAWLATLVGGLLGALLRASGWLPGAGDADATATALAWGGPAAGFGLVVAVLQGLQAALAAWLLQHGGDREAARLDTGDRLRRLTLVAAPAGAALGAGVALLAGGLGLLPGAEALAFGARPLWAQVLGRFVIDGSALVLGAAIVLPLIGRPGPGVWQPRRRLITLPLGLALLVLLIGLHEVARRDERRLESRFGQEAVARQARLQRLLVEPASAVVGVRGMLAVGGEALTPSAFDAVATAWTTRQPGLLALGWLRVGGEGAGADAAPRVVHAQGRRQLGAGLAGGPGADTVLDPVARRLIGQALTQEGLVAGPLGPDAGERPPRLLLVQAVQAAAEPASPVGRARYLAFALLDLQQQVASALPADDDADLRLCIFDAGPTAAGPGAGTPPDAPQRPDGPGATAPPPPGPAAAAPPLWLAGSSLCRSAPSAGAFRVHGGQMMLAGRALSVLAIEPPTADNRLFTALWLLALPSMAGAAMLATLLLAVSGRMNRIESRVAERTAELQAEVAERRQTEAALAQSEQRFRAIFESVGIGLTLVDREGRFLMVNPAFAQLMGCSAASLVGRPLSEVLLPDVPDDDGTARAVGGEGARRQRYLTPDGRMLHMAATIRTLHDSLGEPIATAAALHDLSPVLKRREAERARDEADIANRTKSDFLARLSHELRAPLQAIVGFAQLVDDASLEDAAPAQLQRRLALIRQAGWHVLDMVNDVLDLSRLEAGTLRLAIGPVRLPEVVEASTTMLEPAAERGAVRVELSLSPQAEWVEADALRLRQVLVNLVGNAIKYNRPGGRVTVRTRPGDLGGVRIEVEDTGIGIAPDQIEELFRPFHRLGRARANVPGQPADEGSGIGLVICRRLIELMHGQLDVVSHPGEGSVFSVLLPAASGPSAPRFESTGAAPLTSQVSIGTVLCIDDDAADMATVARLLQAQDGLTLLQAATAAEGLKLAPEADVLLLDLDLPDQPGLDLLKTIAGDVRLKRLKVIVVSAETRPERIDACFDAGAAAFLDKPLQAEALLRALRQALDGA